ncbi:hypothetical protein AB0M68_38835 [Streptomyces sp. NPDC051453]|uniref:hypothetical protein n=1 Tax=Streptomyces sp. NPDC051453 TaxID=3154941 RepID=UPI0034343392
MQRGRSGIAAEWGLAVVLFGAASKTLSQINSSAGGKGGTGGPEHDAPARPGTDGQDGGHGYAVIYW